MYKKLHIKLAANAKSFCKLHHYYGHLQMHILLNKHNIKLRKSQSKTGCTTSSPIFQWEYAARIKKAAYWGDTCIGR